MVLVLTGLLLGQGSGAATPARVTAASQDSCLAPSGDTLGATDLTRIERRSGSLIELCAGTFHINDTIDLDQGTTLRGAGRDATIIRAAVLRSATGRVCGIEGAAMVEVNERPDGDGSCVAAPAPGVEIAGLTLDGDGASWPQFGINSWNNGWSADSCAATSDPTLHVHDITVRGLSRSWSHGIRLGNVCDVVVERNEIRAIDPNDGGEGIGVTTLPGSAVSRSEHVRIRDNIVDGVGGRGIVCATPSGANDPDHTARAISVRSNVVTNVGDDGWGIELYHGCDDSFVEDNRLDQGISVVESLGVAVRRNTVAQPQDASGFVGIELGTSRDVVAADNVVDSGVNHGIAVLAGSERDVERLALLRNDVRAAREIGLWFKSDDAGQQRISHIFAEGGTVDSTRGGLLLGGHGVALWNVVENLTMTGIALTDNAGSAITHAGIAADRLAVRHSTLTGNSDLVDWRTTPPANVNWEHNDCGDPCPDLDAGEWGERWSPPKPSISMPATAVAGEPVSYRGSKARHVLWDLGTGPARTADGTVVYPKPGVYRVTLVAWGENGQAASAEHTITVS
ncbi:right-handed parallel beta-helix repeat-containing protein [Haloechinothrix halophila]|uniref:right-handed parallel beta-helix repeat-containing protein n=1 Tax=Haloechinothrix halophila TaxID=1069073 RepID=UPI0004230435|nr:right-handed parallel beta-helix repeat-containing protein [Haloechinothrix halophila]